MGRSTAGGSAWGAFCVALALAPAVTPASARMPTRTGHGAAALARHPAANTAATRIASALPVADRDALADRFLTPQIGALMVDADLRAAFTRDGLGLVYRRGAPGAGAWHYLDLATRQSRLLMDEAQLKAALVDAIGPVDAARLPPEIDHVDYAVASGVFRFEVGDRGWQLSRDGRLTPSTDDADAARSPDGRYLIVAHGYDLYARDVATGRETRLTADGSRDRPYGRGIARLPDILRAGTEEPPMPASVRWSPDSRRILTWRLDTRDVPRLSITQANPPGSLYPRSFQYIYPTAGSPHLPQAQRLAIDVEAAVRTGTAQVVPLAIPSESLLYPNDPSFGWQGDHARAVWTERGYGQVAVYNADPATGTARVVARERGNPLVFVTSSFFYGNDTIGGELLVSERSGWAQLYLVDRDHPDGGRALTHGDWEVIGIEHVDPKARTVLVTGVGREPGHDRYDRALYRVPIDGGAPVLLTPEPLDHAVEVSPDGAWVVDAMSSPDQPTRTVLRDGRDGHIVMELAHAGAAALRATGYILPERFTGVAADGMTPLHAMIYRPIGFDPRRRYPVIDNVYTGPTTTQVPATWTDAIGASASSVAQLGAIVVMIDGRGTSRRGAALRAPSYRNLGEVGLDDHIAVIRQMAARYPALDPARVGVYGGSAGGYDAARFVLRRPNFFKVAVAWSGNHDLRLDKAWWPEVSMGDADAATWERNSNMSVAGNLTGKLLLVHGDVDDNVPVTESFRLAKAIIDAGRDVDLVILPNTRHRVYQPFFWRKLRDYFTRNLIAPTAPVTQAAPATPTASGS